MNLSYGSAAHWRVLGQVLHEYHFGYMESLMIFMINGGRIIFEAKPLNIIILEFI